MFPAVGMLVSVEKKICRSLMSVCRRTIPSLMPRWRRSGRVSFAKSVEISIYPEILVRDLYDVYAENPRLLPTLETDSATYLSAGTRTIDRDSTVDDICDFVVEYINSDVLVRVNRSGWCAAIIDTHPVGLLGD